ncbi:GIY-YIG nuclease family protein [Nostoc sp. FACHB-110]|nr:GIY-YIG nuclease family protein [Nostoc sp. FACHB-110]
MEAEGYHGLIPGCYLRRCKIGLSRNPQLRLENFHSNQPPCNIKILTTVYVQDMAEVETQLHQQFKKCQVKGLAKSREWFDFNPLQMPMVRYAIAKHDIHIFTFSELPFKLILLCLLGLLSVGVIAGRLTTQPVTPLQEKLKVN